MTRVSSSVCWTSSRTAASPARPPARAEVTLFGHELRRRLLERAGWFRSGQEIDVDPADLSSPELDVAGTAPVVGIRLPTLLNPREQRVRDDTGRAFGE